MLKKRLGDIKKTINKFEKKVKRLDNAFDIQKD